MEYLYRLQERRGMHFSAKTGKRTNVEDLLKGPMAQLRQHSGGTKISEGITPGC